jgi:hypothetical protein
LVAPLSIEEGLDLSMVPELEAADKDKTVINLFLIVHEVEKAVWYKYRAAIKLFFIVHGFGQAV